MSPRVSKSFLIPYKSLRKRSFEQVVTLSPTNSIDVLIASFDWNLTIYFWNYHKASVGSQLALICLGGTPRLLTRFARMYSTSLSYEVTTTVNALFDT